MLDLDRKYESILSHEEHFAYRLGREVIDKPAVSVWMILLPVLFVHHMYRVSSYKNGVRAFAGGILEPRQKALDKAREEVESGQEREYRLEEYFPYLEFGSDRDRTLAEKQVRLIRILQKHYRCLLKAESGSY
ncbi:MAG: NF038143 family protein, partial [Thermodesulfobacteriota bacterium]